MVAAATSRSIDVIQKELRSAIESGATAPSESGDGVNAVKTEDSMEVDGGDTRTSPADGASALKDLATVGLASAGARASALASHEEREMTRLVGAAVNLTLQKFELKLAQFSEVEAIVQAERRDLERGRQQLFLDRLAFKKRMKDMEDTFRAASLKAPEEGMRMMSEALGMASGKRFGFQQAQDLGNSVTSLSAEGLDVKSIEI